MDKEMEFKNKSIKEKVNGSFEMIIVLYVVSVAFAVFLMFAVKIVPSATEYFVLAGFKRFAYERSKIFVNHLSIPKMRTCDYNSLQYSGNIETG